MSRGKNSIKSSDISTTPIKLKYSSSYLYDDYDDYGIQVFYGVNGTINVSGSVDDKTLRYNSIKQLYYSNYLTGSFPVSASGYDNFLQSTAASGTLDADIRYFPTESDSRISVLSIPKNVYGEQISRKSFIMSSSAYYIADDGNGNIRDWKNSNIHVGNIIYKQGIVIITNPNYIDIAAPACELAGYLTSTTSTSTTTSTTTAPVTTTSTTTTTTAAPTTTTTSTTTSTTTAGSTTTTTSTTTSTTTATPTTTTSTTTSTTTVAPTTTTSTTTTTTTEAATVQIYAKYVNQQAAGLEYSTDNITWTALANPNNTTCSSLTTLTNLPGGNGTLYIRAIGSATISICKSPDCSTCPGFGVGDTFGCPQVQIATTSGTNTVYMTVDGQNCV